MTAGDRLREARERIGFSSAAAAAKAIGVPIATYTGHEANHRGFPAKKASLYAKHFHVSVNWLLFGETPDEKQITRVPVIATVDSGKSRVREINGAAVNISVVAPSDLTGVRYAFTLAHDAAHQFAGWTLFGEEKVDRLSQIAEDKLCVVGLCDGHVVIAKPRRSAASGLYHLHFFGETPHTDVKIDWISRIVACRM